MADLRLQTGPDFALMAAALYFFGGLSVLCAVLAAAAVHELGHLLAMELCGAEAVRLRLGAGGAVLDYAMPPSAGREALILAAGPAAGLAFGGICMALPPDFFHYTGAAALLASFFNLLPALPMDGGRLLFLALQRVSRPGRAGALLSLTGSLSALALFALGLRWRMIVLCAAGIWLGLLVIFPSLR